MKLVIIGAGAIGLLLYKQLNTTLKRPNQLALLTRTNSENNNALLSYQDIDNHEQKIKINYASLIDLQCADVVIVCVKAFHVNAVITHYQKDINPQASIVLCHNGMGVFEELPQNLTNRQPFYALLTTHGSRKDKAMAITHTGNGVYDLGCLNSELHPLDVSIKDLFMNSLANCTFHQNIRLKQWQKLAVNCVINPITAINKIPNGEIFNTCYGALRRELIEEFVAIAELAGISFDVNEVNETVEHVAISTAKNTSSMLSDVLANRKTEITYINGFLLDVAGKYNQRELAKTHQAIYQQITNL